MKTQMIKKYIKEGVIFLAVAFIFANILSFYKTKDLNKDFPNLSSAKLLSGKNLELDNTKPILIYFWATWCPICKTTSPNIEFLSKYINVLSIAVKSDNTNEYIRESGYDFDVIDDTDGNISRDLNIGVFPTIIIYDKNKRAFFSDTGYTSTLSLFLKYILLH